MRGPPNHSSERAPLQERPVAQNNFPCAPTSYRDGPRTSSGIVLAIDSRSGTIRDRGGPTCLRGGAMSRAILRPGQVALLDKIDAAIAEGSRRIVAQAPTGFGKTIVAAHRLRLLQDAGRRAIIMVPALSLVDQTVEKLFAEGVTNVGVIQASHPMTNSARPIQVATPQSLQRREIPDADEILIDEVHKWFKIYPKLLADPRFADVPIIGLTATPWSKGLGKHFDRLIVGATTAQLIEDKLPIPVPLIRTGFPRPGGRPDDGGRLPRGRPRRAPSTRRSWSPMSSRRG